jgi:diguanylate cyclase (GGDEF)-like protein
MTLSERRLVFGPLAARILAALMLPALTLALPRMAHAAAPATAAALVDQATAAMRDDPETGRRDAEAALTLLARQPDADEEIRAHLLLCDYYSERSKDSATAQIEASRAALPKATRPGLESGIVACEGELLESEGDNVGAMSHYERAVQLAETHHEDKLLADALFLRGYLSGLSGQYSSSLIDLRRAQTLFEQLKLPLHVLTTLNSIAIQYNRMGDYAQAKQIYERTVNDQRQAGLKREELVTLVNLGRAEENLHEWDNARASYGTALAYSRELDYQRGEAYALRGLGSVAAATGDPGGAMSNLDRALQLWQKTPDARLGGQIQLARGTALHLQHHLPESETALNTALDVFRHADSQSEMSTTLAELASVAADEGKWNLAYTYRTEAQQLSDKLLKEQLDQRFALLKVEFDTSAKDKENNLLRLQNAANQQTLQQDRRSRQLQALVIALVLALLVALGVLFLNVRRSARRSHRLAMTDELTRVPNRRAVLMQLEELIHSPQHGQQALLILDIDHFKHINDRYGHQAGDTALRLVAEQLRAPLTPPAFTGRLGGEEFVVVLPNATLEAACDLAERYRLAVQALDGSQWSAAEGITVSIGVTLATRSDIASSMLTRADHALYEAKRDGRNCVRVQLAENDPRTPVQEPVFASGN